MKFEPCTRRKLKYVSSGPESEAATQQCSPKVNSQRGYIAWHKMAYHTEGEDGEEVEDREQEVEDSVLPGQVLFPTHRWKQKEAT